MMSTANIATNIESKKIEINKKNIKLNILKRADTVPCAHNQF
ncbi:MAG: hypothetical protein PHN22_03455 [Candidatus ainarchaeum sp.]|nr:hypothetical protein [Candidatus ainarchaeum sp.]